MNRVLSEVRAFIAVHQLIFMLAYWLVVSQAQNTTEGDA